MIDTHEATRMNEESKKGGDMMTNDEEDVYTNSPVISDSMREMKQRIELCYENDAHYPVILDATNAINAIVKVVDENNDRLSDVEAMIASADDENLDDSNDETFESRIEALEDNIKVIDEKLNGLIELLLGVQDL